jgi:xyloglucan-specific exo-beta-1,4-glucanase
VSQCNAVGFGKAASGASFPTVFIWGKVGTGVVGIYRSIDAGATWLRINDDQHQFGGPGNGQFIVGDLNVSGRVYMSTAGLGIVYGEPN